MKQYYRLNIEILQDKYIVIKQSRHYGKLKFLEKYKKEYNKSYDHRKGAENE